MIGPGAHTFDGTGADPYDSFGCWGGGAVGFRYLPSTSGFAQVDLCTCSNLPTGLSDTVLAVMEGTQVIACSDDSCMYLSRASWSAAAGHEYWIHVVDFWGQGGSTVVTLAGPTSRTDGCANPPRLEVGEQLLLVRGAGTDGSSACDAGAIPDSMFGFVAPTDGVLVVTTNGTHDDQGSDTGPDTLLSVHSACPGSPAEVIACADDSPGLCPNDSAQIRDAYVEAPMAAGAVSYVRVMNRPTLSLAPIILTTSFRPGLTSCAGDGTASACPCANYGDAGHGCGNSTTVSGVLLSADGTPSVSADSLTRRATSLPPDDHRLVPAGHDFDAGRPGLTLRRRIAVRVGFPCAPGIPPSFRGSSGLRSRRRKRHDDRRARPRAGRRLPASPSGLVSRRRVVLHERDIQLVERAVHRMGNPGSAFARA